MGRSIASSFSSDALANALGLRHTGKAQAITRIDSLDEAGPGSLCFAKNLTYALQAPPNVILITSSDCRPSDGSTTVLDAIQPPRLEFAKALALIEARAGFVWSEAEPDIHPTAVVGKNVVLGKGVRIGAYSRIYHNVVIGDEVIIGERCVIKSGAVIGEEGFGFERDESGKAIRLPHVGSVLIGNDVEIGSLTTVCRGTLKNTFVADGAKIDDHVHIAHNVYVGRDALVIACAEISGGVHIGDRAWIAPNAAVLNQIRIGADSTVGLGAVVIKHVEAGSTVAGSPAKPLAKRSE